MKKRILFCLCALVLLLGSCAGPESVSSSSPTSASESPASAGLNSSEPASKQPLPAGWETAPPASEPQQETIKPHQTQASQPSSLPQSSTPEASASPSEETETIDVTVTAMGEAIVSGSVPASETQTAFDALSRICSENDISLTTVGSGGTVYVKAIGDYAELDYGPLSGWQYKLNGVHMSVGSGSAEVKAGDSVEFYYTEDFTKE